MSEGSLLLLQSGGRPSTWSPPAGTRRAALPGQGVCLMLSAGSAWAIRTSAPLARSSSLSFPNSLPPKCLFRRLPALLVITIEFLDLNSSCLTLHGVQPWAGAHACIRPLALLPTWGVGRNPWLRAKLELWGLSGRIGPTKPNFEI